MSRDRGACGLGRRREERLRLGGARGLPADDERGDHEHRPDEEERRERAGAAGVRRRDVEAGLSTFSRVPSAPYGKSAEGLAVTGKFKDQSPVVSAATLPDGLARRAFA